MRHLFYNILFIACALLLFACEEKDGMGSRVGYLRLSVGGSDAVETKAGEEPAYDPKAFAVKITDKETSVVVEEFDTWETDESKLVELEEGTYIISASSAGFDNEPGFDKPYYAGSKEVTIKAGDELNETLTCTLANVKVSVVFDEKLLAKYADRSISVTVGATDGIPLSFGKDKCGREVQAYFPAGGDLTAKIAISKLSGEQGSYTSEYTIEKVEAKHYYVLTYKLESAGSGDFNITYDPNGWTEYDYEFVVNPVASNVATLSANPWAKFAYLTASGAKSATGAAPGNPKLQYRQQGTDTWDDLETTATGEGDDAVYTATATSLAPNTAYEYRLVGDNGFEIAPQLFTTEDPTSNLDLNLSFDSWYKSGKNQYACTETAFSAGKKFWDSGNEGANTLKEINPTKEETSDVVKGSAARLTSTEVSAIFFNVFAAGSLYSGDFLEAVVGGLSPDKSGAKLSFGQPYAARPTRLTGYYKYNPVSVNYTSEKVPQVKSGDRDSCSIYVALMDWDTSFEVNTQSSTFVDLNDESVIAYGELSKAEASPESMNAYQPFTIDIKYRDLNRKPTYILMVCSSSKYGDYFVGGVGSCLLVDEFNLEFDGEPKVKE